jgi:hypothetical protein
MKYEREVIFKCDHCKKNITNKKHIRIFMGSTSGWMVPPFIGGQPSISLASRKPEFHFDIPECFAAFFVEKLHAIRTDTGRDAIKNSISSIGRKMLEEISSERSRMRGTNNLGACDSLQREASERSVGDRDVVRVGAFGRGFGESDQRMDIIKSDVKERRAKISTFRLGAKEVVSKFFIWAVVPFIAKIKS